MTKNRTNLLHAAAADDALQVPHRLRRRLVVKQQPVRLRVARGAQDAVPRIRRQRHALRHSEPDAVEQDLLV
jgi:hypothetical protein